MPIISRNGTFHLVRRVPVRFKAVDPRTQIWISQKTDSKSEAERKADAVWKMRISAWEAQIDDDTDDAEARLEAAKRLADASGYRYMPIEKVARLPLPELKERMEATVVNGKPDRFLAEALLGSVQKPKIALSRGLELFFKIADNKTRNKSKDQIRRWRNPRIKAFRNLIDVIGDIPIDEITAEDTLDFRAWWWDRIQNENLTTNSANKDLIHIAGTLRTVNKRKHLGLTFPFSDMSFSEDDMATRPPIPTDWIIEKMLAPGAFDGLNTEARCIVLGMINTGYRPSEGACLPPDSIRLDCEYPHIEIVPNGRTLKSKHARRIIPLTGTSLTAFCECPEGFPRYADSPSLSATVNKFMRENKLFPPEGGHTM